MRLVVSPSGPAWIDHSTETAAAGRGGRTSSSDRRLSARTVVLSFTRLGLLRHPNPAELDTSLSRQAIIDGILWGPLVGVLSTEYLESKETLCF